MTTLDKKIAWMNCALDRVLDGNVSTIRMTLNNKNVTMYIHFDFLFIDVIVDRPLFNSITMDANFEGSITAKVEMIRFRVKNEKREGALAFLMSL